MAGGKILRDLQAEESIILYEDQTYNYDTDLLESRQAPNEMEVTSTLPWGSSNTSLPFIRIFPNPGTSRMRENSEPLGR